MNISTICIDISDKVTVASKLFARSKIVYKISQEWVKKTLSMQQYTKIWHIIDIHICIHMLNVNNTYVTISMSRILNQTLWSKCLNIIVIIWRRIWSLITVDNWHPIPIRNFTILTWTEYPNFNTQQLIGNLQFYKPVWILIQNYRLQR